MFFLNSDSLSKHEKNFILSDSNQENSFDFFLFSRNINSLLVICPNSLSHFDSNNKKLDRQPFIGTFSIVFSECLSASSLFPIKSFYDDYFVDFCSLHIDKIKDELGLKYIIEFSSFIDDSQDIILEHSFDFDVDDLFTNTPFFFSSKKVPSPYKNDSIHYLKINLNRKNIDIYNSNQFNRTLNAVIDSVSSIVL